MKFILFPPGGVDSFVIKVEGTVATPLAETRILKGRERLKNRSVELQDFRALVGQHTGGAGEGTRNSLCSSYCIPYPRVRAYKNSR